MHLRALIPERRRDLERLTRRNRDRGVGRFTAHPVGVLVDDRIGVWAHAIDEAAVAPQPGAQAKSQNIPSQPARPQLLRLRSSAPRALFLRTHYLRSRL